MVSQAAKPTSSDAQLTSWFSGRGRREPVRRRLATPLAFYSAGDAVLMEVPDALVEDERAVVSVCAKGQ